MNLLSSAFLVTWLTASIRLAGPVLMAALGEVFAERAGVLNVGIEGTMLVGALAAFLASIYVGSAWFSLLIAMLVGVGVSLLLSWMYVTVRASQVVVGLVFNVLALGVASAVYGRALAHGAMPESIAMFQQVHVPWLTDLPVVGSILFGRICCSM